MKTKKQLSARSVTVVLTTSWFWHATTTCAFCAQQETWEHRRENKLLPQDRDFRRSSVSFARQLPFLILSQQPLWLSSTHSSERTLPLPQHPLKSDRHPDKLTTLPLLPTQCLEELLHTISSSRPPEEVINRTPQVEFMKFLTDLSDTKENPVKHIQKKRSTTSALSACAPLSAQSV